MHVKLKGSPPVTATGGIGSMVSPTTKGRNTGKKLVECEYQGKVKDMTGMNQNFDECHIKLFKS